VEESTEKFKFLSVTYVQVFVIFQMSESLQNILGVFRDSTLLWECLLLHAPQDKLVITFEDITELEPDSKSLIATKLFEPEIRVARCLINEDRSSFVAT
ncbi:hypothetical protein BVY02_02615, partial [bacterium J17]